MWPAPEGVLEVTAPEHLPALAAAADTAGEVYLAVRLYCALSKCSLQRAQCCSALLWHRWSSRVAPPASCGTGCPGDQNISKVLCLLGTLPTLTCQGSSDLDMGWYLKLQQIAANNN